MKFGDRIKTLRKEKGYSQKELGDALSLGQTTIANYEKNIRFPSPEILIQIANLFDESIDRLVGRLDEVEMEAFSVEEINKLAEEILDMLLNENESGVMSLVGDLQLNQDRIIQLYESVYKRVLMTIGDMWVAGKITVAKEHYISAIVHKLIAQSFSNTYNNELLYNEGDSGNVICMSLSGESHTLGVRMISDYFVMLGFKSYYIGSNVPTDALIDLIISTKPKVLAISVTIASHIDSLRNLVLVMKNTKALEGIADDMKILVGGQAFKSPQEALDAGADYYANSYEELEKIFSKNR